LGERIGAARRDTVAYEANMVTVVNDLGRRRKVLT
jgi:hypothetical protein